MVLSNLNLLLLTQFGGGGGLDWVYLVRLPQIGLRVLYQPGMIDDDECGAFGGMRIGKGNRSTLRKPAPVPLRPPQIPMTWPDLGWNPGCWGGKTATNRLSYGTAYQRRNFPWLCYPLICSQDQTDYTYILILVCLSTFFHTHCFITSSVTMDYLNWFLS
jgi:hypothetical protein